jgi:hypothetical protein
MSSTKVNRLTWLVTLLVISFALVWMRARLNFNGPYLDESDYLFVGKILLDGGVWQTHTYIFSSDIPLYIFGIGDSIAGLMGARAIAAILGICSLVFYFDAVRRFFRSKHVAFFATALLALSASHGFISKFAVYDIVCFVSFIAGLWALSFAFTRSGYQAQIWALIASLCLVTAFLNKYVIILEMPLIGLMILIYRPRLAFALFTPAIMIGCGYIYHYRADLQILYQQQIVGSHGNNASYGNIIGVALSYVWPVLLLFILEFKQHWQRTGGHSRNQAMFRWSMWLALPIIFYHLRAHDLISFYKHIVYSVVFLAPLAGVYLVRLLRQKNNYIAQLPALILIIVAIQGMIQIRAIENAYPDGRSAVTFLKDTIGANSTILSEDPYLLRHQLRNQIKANHIYENAWFDNDGDQKYTRDDVIAGVWDGKFDFLYLDGRITPVTTEKLRKYVVQNKYKLIYQQPYHTSSVMFYQTEGKIEIYQRRAPYSGQYPLIPQ